MPTLRYVVADVFTDTPLQGNQLAVFTDGRGVDEGRMQALAKELNLSETVFVLPAEQGGDARMRIFTPSRELQFAGHPTLGTAFVLAAPLQLERIRLETGRGIVTVALEREGGRIRFGWMEQPLPSFTPFERSDALLGALGVDRAELPLEICDNGVPHVLVALESPQIIAGLEPDIAAVERAAGPRGSFCFARDGDAWKARMFGPGLGMAEDPATGSAVGPLAVFLARHGWAPAGDEVEVVQGVEMGRPSHLFARVTGTAEAPEAVEAGGSAVIVARGEFRL